MENHLVGVQRLEHPFVVLAHSDALCGVLLSGVYYVHPQVLLHMVELGKKLAFVHIVGVLNRDEVAPCEGLVSQQVLPVLGLDVQLANCLRGVKDKILGLTSPYRSTKSMVGSDLYI